MFVELFCVFSAGAPLRERDAEIGRSLSFLFRIAS